MSFRIVGSTTRASGRFFDFLEVEMEGEDGRRHARDVIRHPGGVGVLPILDNDVLLVSQYRVALDRDTLEIPAGKLDRGEHPDQAAPRELAEELGLVGSLTGLGAVAVSPGYTDEIIHLYLATDLTAVPSTPDGAEEEASEVVRLSLGEALQMVHCGSIRDAKTQVALLMYKARETR